MLPEGNTIGVILLAGGSGSRSGLRIPKQFHRVKNRMVISYSLDVFKKYTDHIVIVSHPDWIKTINKELQPYSVIMGGKTRQQSVYNGLEYMETCLPKWIFIHDSARPFIDHDLLKRCLDSTVRNGSGIPAIAATDTLATIDSQQRIINYPDRKQIVRIQTPQAFDYQKLWQSHQKALQEKRHDFTDDSQIYIYGGNQVYRVEGNVTNIKITYPEDLKLFDIYHK